jgi:hypothetical protein
MHERRTGILLAAAATTGLGLASAAQAVTIDFDTQSDFDNNFSAPETAGEVAWSADTGIGGVAGDSIQPPAPRTAKPPGTTPHSTSTTAP